jgi:hypothetical protein
VAQTRSESGRDAMRTPAFAGASVLDGAILPVQWAGIMGSLMFNQRCATGKGVGWGRGQACRTEGMSIAVKSGYM